MVRSVAILAVAVAAALAPNLSQGTAGDSEGHSTAQPRGYWTRLPHAPDPGSGYQELTAVRIGHWVVVIAGVDHDQATLKGLVLDSSRRWRRASPSGLWWRYGYTALRAREEVIVWGGCCGPGGRGSRALGAAYRPARNRWRKIAPSPLGNRFGHSAVWTGSEMIIWGGASGSVDGVPAASGPKRTGAAYNPRTGSWRRIAPAPLRPRHCPAAVWTGEEMIIWGGALDGCGVSSGGQFRLDGAAYDPAHDRWRRIPRAPIRSGFGAEHDGPEAVWTGDEMIVWNGYRAAAYDPARNSWRGLRRPIPQARDPRGARTVVWAIREMIVWGGPRADGAAYDPAKDRWRVVPPAPIPGRNRHAAVWADWGMLVFGGCCRGSQYRSDAALYRPPWYGRFGGGTSTARGDKPTRRKADAGTRQMRDDQ